MASKHNVLDDLMTAHDLARLVEMEHRSVLGCMNDMAFMCETVTNRSGGLVGTAIAELSQALRRNTSSARGCQPPIELTSQHLRARR
jgi:hypothetical protein